MSGLLSFWLGHGGLWARPHLRSALILTLGYCYHSRLNRRLLGRLRSSRGFGGIPRATVGSDTGQRSAWVGLRGQDIVTNAGSDTLSEPSGLREFWGAVCSMPVTSKASSAPLTAASSLRAGETSSLPPPSPALGESPRSHSRPVAVVIRCMAVND